MFENVKVILKLLLYHTIKNHKIPVLTIFFYLPIVYVLYPPGLRGLYTLLPTIIRYARFIPTTIAGVVQLKVTNKSGLTRFIPTGFKMVIQLFMQELRKLNGFIPTTIVGVVQPQKVGLPSGKVVF